MTNAHLPAWQEGWVARHELLERLERAADVPLVLVRAPSGFGKTTLLTLFAHRAAERRIAWLTLEEADNDPTVFWHRVFSALQLALPGHVDEALTEFGGSVVDVERWAIPNLVNALADMPWRVSVIIDDYQLIDNPQIHDTMQLLLAHLPRSGQVMLAAWTEPPLALSSMRARRLVSEITASDLAFSEAETAELMLRSQAAVTKETVAQIQRQTEGWAAGVYLAAMGESSVAGAGDRRHRPAIIGADDYIASEVLAGFGPDERSFLRETSILERLNGDLCDHVAERSGSAELLRSFADGNLLIVALGVRDEWFRYHHLLRNALLSELQREEPENVARLHQRAHQWFLGTGAVTEAIRHALDAGDPAAAADLVCAYFFDYSDRVVTTKRWLDWLPEDLITGYPPLTLAAAYINAFLGDVARSRHLLAVASEAAYEGPPPDGSSSFESAVALCRAGLYPEGVTDAAANGEKAYRLEPPGSPWRPMAALVLGVARMSSGDLAAATNALTEAARHFDRRGINSYTRGQLAILSTWTGDWEKAEDLSREALDDFGPIREGAPEGDASITGPARVAAAAAALHRSDAENARTLLRSLDMVLPSGFPHLELELRTLAAELYVALGDANRATQHAAAAAGALDTLGDGGIYENRLTNVLDAIDAIEPSSLPPPEPEPLSVRESQVLHLLASNLTLRAIGFELYISRNTVKTHAAQVYRKLGATGRDEAVARARAQGLI